MGLEEDIEALEREIAETPYNKATEQHIGRLKARVAELKEDLEAREAGSGGGGGYHVAKSGDATIAMVGFPSVGKSTLLNALTNAESEVGDYDFTTLEVTPGMIEYRGAKLQLLDVPGLIEGASRGRGRGREVLSMVRSADLVLFVLSPFEVERYADLRDELYANQVRLDTTPPRVSVTPTPKGGIDVTAPGGLELDEATVAEVVREHGHVNADVHIAEPVDVDRLIDGIMANRVYLPSLVAVNKVDLVDERYRPTLEADLREQGLDPEAVAYVSAETGRGLETLCERLWDRLGLLRVYLREPGDDPDLEEPLIVREGDTVADAIERLGGSMRERVRYARITGDSARHEDQQVGLDHVLADGDVLTLVLRR
ncbi:MAG: OBG GTPase family GTP-binding protein [Halobacteriales archaeon]